MSFLLSLGCQRPPRPGPASLCPPPHPPLSIRLSVPHLQSICPHNYLRNWAACPHQKARCFKMKKSLLSLLNLLFMTGLTQSLRMQVPCPPYPAPLPQADSARAPHLLLPPTQQAPALPFCLLSSLWLASWPGFSRTGFESPSPGFDATPPAWLNRELPLPAALSHPVSPRSCKAQGARDYTLRLSVAPHSPWPPWVLKGCERRG